MRIVSLMPSATEILCELGLGDQLVAVSHECDFPEFVSSLPRLTRSLIPPQASSGEIDQLVRERVASQTALYSLDIPLLQRLQPDLLVTQSLCDVCAVAEDEVIAAANSLHIPPQIVNLAPTRLFDLETCFRLVAQAANVPNAADAAIESMRRRVATVMERSNQIAVRPTVVLLEWVDPPFCSGHWSPELVRLAGGIEVVGREGERSRSIDWSEIVDLDPEMLVVSCCGFNTERAMRELAILRQYPHFGELTCVRNARVAIADGNAYFHRPGPRLVDSLEILAHALHPAVHPIPSRAVPAYVPSQTELMGE